MNSLLNVALYKNHRLDLDLKECRRNQKAVLRLKMEIKEKSACVAEAQYLQNTCMLMQPAC
jgi:hypothetical protein